MSARDEAVLVMAETFGREMESRARSVDEFVFRAMADALAEAGLLGEPAEDERWQRCFQFACYAPLWAIEAHRKHISDAFFNRDPIPEIPADPDEWGTAPERTTRRKSPHDE